MSNIWNDTGMVNCPSVFSQRTPAIVRNAFKEEVWYYNISQTTFYWHCVFCGFWPEKKIKVWICGAENWWKIWTKTIHPESYFAVKFSYFHVILARLSFILSQQDISPQDKIRNSIVLDILNSIVMSNYTSNFCCYSISVNPLCLQTGII